MVLFKNSDKKYLQVKLADDRSNVYPRGYIYDNDNNLVATELLTHVADGFYSKEITLVVGSYQVIYRVFKDLAGTKKDKRYSDGSEFIRVENLEENINNKIDDCISEVDDLDGQIT
jgi:hypothetical protein